MAQNKPLARKKVLFLITKATQGGAQRYVYDLATSLPRGEFESVVACGQLWYDTEAEDFKTYLIPSLGRDVAIISDIASFFQILMCFWREQPDIVHLNSSKAAALGALAARLSPVKKIIFTVHGWPFGEKRNVLSKLLIWIISWFTALLSHHVICVSNYDLTAAKRMPLIARKASCIHNGIAPMQFGSGDIIRRAFPVGAKITGTIGELTGNKNQIALIEEARRNPNMSVAIVGEGELKSMLGEKIRQYDLVKRVNLFGYLPAADVLKGFDTFALPSLKEGLPYVLLEAKQAGLPIIANHVGGVAEILDAKDMQEFSLEQMVKKTAQLYLPAQAS